MPSGRITPVPYQKLVKVFALDGFVIKRQRGDHLLLTNLRTAGMSRERYFELLDQV